MPLKRVNLRNPSQLPFAVHQFGLVVNRQTVKAMVRTARFGQTAVIRTAARTKPKPEATQTYRNSWGTTKTRTGAILGNSALASYFVERGRRAGKMPPFSDPSNGILAWVIAKRFNFDEAGNISRKRRKPKGTARSASPEPKKTEAEKARTKEQNAAAKSAGASNAEDVNKARNKSRKATKRKQKKYEQQVRIAHLIARKIAKKGTPGRFVLLRTMPAIGKRARKETLKAIRQASRKGTP